MKPTLLVLAAGMGSRYGGLKQIDPVGPNGETIIDYSVYDAIRHGYGKIVFVIRKDIDEDFRRVVGSKYEGKIAIEYAYQELDKLPQGLQLQTDRSKPWGTGHAIWVAKDVINEPFAVINADDFYGSDAFKVAAQYLEGAKDDHLARYGMVAYPLQQTLSPSGTVSRGLCQCDDKGFLSDLVETHGIQIVDGTCQDIDANPVDISTLASMNLWLYTPSIFDHLEKDFVDFFKERGHEAKSEFYMTLTVNDCINNDQATVEVFQSNDQWYGVTYREDREFVVRGVQKLISEGVYPESLWETCPA